MRLLLCALLVTPLVLAAGCKNDSDAAKTDKKNPSKEAVASKHTPSAVEPDHGDKTAADASPVAIKDAKATLSGENTQILFTGTKTGGKHDGGFKTFTGTLTLNDKGDAPKSLTLEIEVGSLFTDEPSGKLNNHLKSKDFFDAAKFPKVSFESTKIGPGKDGGHEVTGKLTLHGESKEITFPIKARVAKNTITGESSFQINRTEFGMTYGKGIVNDMVTINVKVGVAGK